MDSRPSKPAVFVLGFAVLLAGVSVVARFGDSLGIPGADGLSWLAQEPVHYAPDPSGWRRAEAAGISYAVPGDWIAVEEGGLKQGYAASWHAPEGEARWELSVLDYPGGDTDAFRVLVDAASAEYGTELDLPLGGNDECREHELVDAYLAGSCAVPAVYLDPETGYRIEAMAGTYFSVQVEQDSAPVIVRLLYSKDVGSDDIATMLNNVRPAPDGWRARLGG